MNENHFKFSLIHKETKKYGDISDDIMEWAVMCAAVIGWPQLRSKTKVEPFGLTQSLVSAKDWSKKWNDLLTHKATSPVLDHCSHESITSQINHDGHFWILRTLVQQLYWTVNSREILQRPASNCNKTHLNQSRSSPRSQELTPPVHQCQPTLTWTPCSLVTDVHSQQYYLQTTAK